MDNSTNRLLDVFFYGLYMDEEILKSKNVIPRNRRIGVVHGYQLRIGKMTTLLRNDKKKAYGIVYSLTHDEIERLYKGSGLDGYVAEALLIDTDDDKTISALCCILLFSPKNSDDNKEYYEKLIQCMKKYKLPIPEEV